jgi:hypothetical protein
VKALERNRKSNFAEPAPVHLQAGESWVATRDLEASGLTHWKRAFTGGFKCRIPAGTVLVVVADPPAGAQASACIPQRYEELESLLVPEADRQSES